MTHSLFVISFIKVLKWIGTTMPLKLVYGNRILGYNFLYHQAHFDSDHCKYDASLIYTARTE